jgi:hypothetical protein
MRLLLSELFLAVTVFLFAPLHSFAQAPPKTEEDLRREAAIAEFTARMRASNYPALFDQAANEFHIPPDVLKGISFAETRWEHLTWPPGETASPETGMPRPFGIMSLWDNPYFGHSLVEAATLIGKDPEELKRDPLQNMRGAAALLRKLYEENAKPDGTTEADPEGWRYAIRKYCGIPELDLSSRHVLNIYTFMSQGYHQYGIEWNARTVDLDPIRRETAQAVAQEKARREATAAQTNSGVLLTQTNVVNNTKTNAVPGLKPGNPTVPQPQVAVAPDPVKHIPWFLALVIAALAIGVYFLRTRKKP